MKLFGKLLSLLSIFTLVFFSDDLKETFTRQYVGSQVFKLTNHEQTGGGTGFVVKIPGKAPVIMTNSHVCLGILKNSKRKTLLGHNSGKQFTLKVLSIFKKHDLCAVEAPKGYRGLSVGDEPSAGQLAAVVGHPSLMPLTVSRGQVIGMEVVQILMEIVDSPEKCEIKDKAIFVPFMGIACVRQYISYSTNIQILPGNSGSPLVDKFGRVIAVMFAGNNDSLWGFAVPNEYLKEFIKQLSK